MDYRDNLYPKIPFYMTYPMQSMYLTEMEYEKDMERMKSYYPSETKAIMKLVEELGEVAEVLNKRAGRKSSDESDLQEELGTELADMLHYIVAIASINEIDLNEIVIQKDRAASLKYHHETNLETFMLNRQR